MKQEPGECCVHCSDCNGYLYAVSTSESKGEDWLLVKCPYECKYEHGELIMKKPPKGWQSGRS